jgi:hypothetical protein
MAQTEWETSLASAETNIVVRTASEAELEQVIRTGQPIAPQPLSESENQPQTAARTPRANPAMGYYDNEIRTHLPNLTEDEKLIEDVFDYAINIKKWGGWTQYIDRSIRVGTQPIELIRSIKNSKGKLTVKQIVESDDFCKSFFGRNRYTFKQKLLSQASNPIQYLLDEMR